MRCIPLELDRGLVARELAAFFVILRSYRFIFSIASVM